MKECVLSSIAIVAIAGICGYGIHHGHDGTLLLSAIAVIAGLAGYQVGKGYSIRKTTKDAQITNDQAGKPSS